jgi:hypothetical protein
MAHMKARLARLESEYKERRSQDERQRILALSQLSPAQRHERMHSLATRIVKRRGIELAPGERVEDAALRVLKVYRGAIDQNGRP